MDIDPATLDAQYVAAAARWPFIASTERREGLPYMLLFAVGSRETNLTNEVGEQAPDGTRGHGVWQYEDGNGRTLPPNFDNDVEQQCSIAAAMLAGLLAHYGGNVQQAADAYNEGQGAEDYNAAHNTPDAGTAHGDYGSDVAARMIYLQHAHPAPNPREADTVTPFFARDTDTNKQYLVTEAGMRPLQNDTEREVVAACLNIAPGFKTQKPSAQLRILASVLARPDGL